MVSENVYINNWSKLPQLFKENIAAGGFEKFNSYRPLQMLTYMLDYSFWKLDVRGYHLTNIILHVLVSLCVFWLVSMLYQKVMLAFLAGLFFALHPMHTEAVAYISGRADSLGALFVLLSLVFYVKYIQLNKISAYFFSLLFFVFALFSRENSLILPFLLLLYYYTFGKKIKIPAFLGVVGVTLTYVLFRIICLKSLMSDIIYSGTLLQRIPGVFIAVFNYIKLLFLPFGLHMEYGQRVFKFTHPDALPGLCIAVVIASYLFLFRRKRGLVFFSLLWFVVTLAPSLNLYPLNAFMAEHWLYLPSIGFFLILSGGIISLYDDAKTKNYAIAFACILILFYSYLTVKQNTYWKDPAALYKRTLRFSPDSVRTYHLLADIYTRTGREEEALELLRKALQLNPTHHYGYNNIGNIYAALKKYPEAIDSYGRAIKIAPNYAGSYNNLGNVHSDTGEWDKAIWAYKKAIELNPNLVAAYNNLANIYNKTGNKEMAAALYRKAIELNPNIPEIHKNLQALHEKN